MLCIAREIELTHLQTNVSSYSEHCCGLVFQARWDPNRSEPNLVAPFPATLYRHRSGGARIVVRRMPGDAAALGT